MSEMNGTRQENKKKTEEEILDARAGFSNVSLHHIGWTQVHISSGSCVSKLQGAELLVHGQDVVVELGGEQQVLQGSHVLLDGRVVLQNEGETSQ